MTTLIAGQADAMRRSTYGTAADQRANSARAVERSLEARDSCPRAVMRLETHVLERS